MEKFTKAEKELLELNPNIQTVLSNQVLYSKEFKQKAIFEYENGKSAYQIFNEAGIDVSILSKHNDYASKTISKWRNANKETINMHSSKKKKRIKKTAYQKLLERNEYLEAENEFLKKLSALCNSYRA